MSTVERSFKSQEDYFKWLREESTISIKGKIEILEYQVDSLLEALGNCVEGKAFTNRFYKQVGKIQEEIRNYEHIQI